MSPVKNVTGPPWFPLLSILAGSVLGIIIGLGELFFGKIPPWLVVLGLSVFAILYPWRGEDQRMHGKCSPCLPDCKNSKTCRWAKDRMRK